MPVALQEVDRALNVSNIAAEGLGYHIAQLYFQLAALDGWEPELPLPAAPLLKPQQQPTGPLPPLRHASDVSSMGSEVVVVVDGDEDPEFEPPGDAALLTQLRHCRRARARRAGPAARRMRSKAAKRGRRAIRLPCRPVMRRGRRGSYRS